MADDEKTVSEVLPVETQEQAEAKTSEARPADAGAVAQEPSPAASEVRGAEIQEQGTGEGALGDDKTEQAAKDKAESLRTLNAEREAAISRAEAAERRVDELERSQVEERRRQMAQESEADQRWLEQLFGQEDVTLTDGRTVSGPVAYAIEIRARAAERRQQDEMSQEQVAVAKQHRDQLLEETVGRLYPGYERGTDKRTALDATLLSSGKVVTHADVLAAIAADAGGVATKDARIAELEAENEALRNDNAGANLDGAGGPPKSTNGRVTGGRLTAAEYKAKLERGEAVTPEEVDAFTASYL